MIKDVNHKQKLSYRHVTQYFILKNSVQAVTLFLNLTNTLIMIVSLVVMTFLGEIECHFEKLFSYKDISHDVNAYDNKFLNPSELVNIDEVV